jgi:hypothetical protein
MKIINSNSTSTPLYIEKYEPLILQDPITINPSSQRKTAIISTFSTIFFDLKYHDSHLSSFRSSVLFKNEEVNRS